MLTASEVESVLNQTDVTTPLGLRDRTIRETFDSTAILCGELLDLKVYDLEPERRSLIVRRGKGRKDPVLPIGRRALLWLEKYLSDVRPRLVERTNTTKLFVSNHAPAVGPDQHVAAGPRLLGPRGDHQAEQLPPAHLPSRSAGDCSSPRALT